MAEVSIDDDLADLAAIKRALNGRLSAIRREMDRLRAAKGEERLVNDHALLRYMERHKGIDVDGMRAELRALADDAIPAKDGEHYRHDGSGVTMVLGDSGQVVTVLSPEQAQKWSVRFERILKRMLDTPPKPRKSKPQ